MGQKGSTRGASHRPQARVNVPEKARGGRASSLISPLLWLALVRPTWGHPQCLDFQPPFRPQWHLEFCSQYERFGCCDQQADNAIAEVYWDIVDQLEAEGLELCEDMLKEIMCQVAEFVWIRTLRRSRTICCVYVD